MRKSIGSIRLPTSHLCCDIPNMVIAFDFDTGGLLRSMVRKNDTAYENYTSQGQILYLMKSTIFQLHVAAVKYECSEHA